MDFLQQPGRSARISRISFDSPFEIVIVVCSTVGLTSFAGQQLVKFVAQTHAAFLKMKRDKASTQTHVLAHDKLQEILSEHGIVADDLEVDFAALPLSGAVEIVQERVPEKKRLTSS